MKIKNILILLCFLITISGMAQNTNLGTNAGNAGTDNTALGFAAGDVVTGNANTFVGSQAGLRNTSGPNNTFMGFASGFSTTTGFQNVFLGGSTGYYNTTGSNNVYVGEGSDKGNVSGARNTLIGQGTGYVSSGSDNSILGNLSGRYSTTGSQNTFLGSSAGLNNTTGSGNIFLGFNAGLNESGSNKLYIENSSTATPLIYGDFSTNQIGINSAPGSFTLNVGGPINATGLYVNGTAVSLGVTSASPWALNGTAINYNNGNVGIGLLSNIPNYKLDVNGTINATGFLLNGEPLSSSQWTTSSGSVYYNTGNVGIGTSVPDAKLTVLGIIHSTEVKVDLNVPGPDYVFEINYQMPTLEDLNAYIKVNKHLPEVPAAHTMEEDGINLGEMNILLLKKIEELTLYIIQQEERIKKLESGK